MAITFSNAHSANLLALRRRTNAQFCVVNSSGRVMKIMNTIIERGVTYLPLGLPSLPAEYIVSMHFTLKGLPMYCGSYI